MSQNTGLIIAARWWQKLNDPDSVMYRLAYAEDPRDNLDYSTPEGLGRVHKPRATTDAANTLAHEAVCN